MSAARNFIEAERGHRLAKLEALRRRGIDPYPVSFARDHAVGDVRGRFAALAAGAVTDTVVRIRGEADADPSSRRTCVRRAEGSDRHDPVARLA